MKQLKLALTHINISSVVSTLKVKVSNFAYMAFFGDSKIR